MERPVIALKVDVDTYVGTRDGVPRLLEILGRSGARATFFFSMGPDNSGKVVRRIFTRKGFLKKQLRSGAPSAFGLKTLLYGTLLPAPMIASSFPHILRNTEELGHETGVHCWDHVKWHDFLPKMTKDAVAAELDRASSLFTEIVGHRPRSTAAPGWTVSAASLEIQDALGLAYCSDARGYAPFYPVVEGRRFTTLQVPTTWPTLDEILGANGISPANAVDYYLTLARPGLNVHTIHAEMEGRILAPLFADLLRKLKEMGATFVTLAEAAAAYGKDAPQRNLAMGEIPGRAGQVAIEGNV